MLYEMTTMELLTDGQKLQEHPDPLFPCSAYYTRWQQGGLQGVPWHWHGEIEMMLVAEGSVQVHFGGKSAHLQVGDGYICNSNIVHSIQMEACQTCRVHSLVFSPDLISGGSGTVYYNKYVAPVLNAPSFPGMALHRQIPWQKAAALSALSQAHAFCRDEPYGFEFQVRRCLSDAWLLILENNPAVFSDQIPENPQDMPRIKTMLTYIRRHCAEPISVSDLANAANICVRECHRCFSRMLHTTPASYIQAYRIQRATALLRETDLSVLDVGLAVGFPNPSYFSRVFKQHMGLTPGHYRHR